MQNPADGDVTQNDSITSEYLLILQKQKVLPNVNIQMSILSNFCLISFLFNLTNLAIACIGNKGTL